MPEADSQPLPKNDSFIALRYKDFRSYVGMKFFFTFAYQMQAVVLGFYVYQLTKSAFALGLIGLSEAIPSIGIALYGGYISDKSEKKKMLLFVFFAVLFSSVVMGVITSKSMGTYLHAGWVMPILYVMVFCNGIARAFYNPAAFTVMANSVPKEIYPNSSSWNSSSWQTASILGPMLAGFTYAFGIWVLRYYRDF